MSSGPVGLRRWRTLIVDDEEPARKLMRSQLGSARSLEVIGEAVDGRDAVRLIDELSPEIVFLDIQMPGLSGLEVVEAVGVERMPLTVFVTAYDEHALRAFRARAFDYVLKPVDASQLRETIERADRRLTADASAGARPDDVVDRMAQLLADLERERAGDGRLTAWDGDSAVLLLPSEIDRVVADANNVRIAAGVRSFVIREPLHAVEARLPSRDFVRLNRSTIVSVNAIREIQPYFRGDYAVVLRDGSHVITGRTYRERIRRRFGLG